MNKELIEKVNEIVSDNMWFDGDKEEMGLSEDGISEIIDLIQPQWINVSDRLPDIKPHRNVEIAYQDAAGKQFSGQVSSRLINITSCYAWREVQPLPKPPE